MTTGGARRAHCTTCTRIDDELPAYGFALRQNGYPVEMASALLFERDRVDEVDDWSSVVDHVGRKSILWIDLDRTETDEIRRLCEMVDLDS